jgi:hypothetical protein
MTNRFPLRTGTMAAQGRPFSPRYDGIPRTDPRMRDSREAAISVKMILEDSWHAFTESEREMIRRGAQALRKALQGAGFLPGTSR